MTAFFRWLERHSRYLQFNKMLGEGTLYCDGNIWISADAVSRYQQVKTISQLIGLGYAKWQNNGYLICHIEDLEQMLTKGIQQRFSSSRWLRQAVTKEKFKNLINDPIEAGTQFCEIESGTFPGVPKGCYIKLTQDRIRAWKCVNEVAQLVNQELAFVVQEGSQNNLYLDVGYLKKIDQPLVVVDSSLSGFRTLLGEPANMKRFLTAIEDAGCKSGNFQIDWNSGSGKSIRLELMSLVDMGIANMSSGETIQIPSAMATWLLETVKNISDRASLTDILEDAIG